MFHDDLIREEWQQCPAVRVARIPSTDFTNGMIYVCNTILSSIGGDADNDPRRSRRPSAEPELHGTDVIEGGGCQGQRMSERKKMFEIVWRWCDETFTPEDEMDKETHINMLLDRLDAAQPEPTEEQVERAAGAMYELSTAEVTTYTWETCAEVVKVHNRDLARAALRAALRGE